MAVDFDAIRRKLSNISGQNRKRENYWRPEQDKTHQVRLLPFPNNEGQPFKERYFYYGIGKNPGLLAPYQFGKRDPFQELITKLREEGGDENKEMLKQLYPKMRAYIPVIVRGDEKSGPKLWACGKAVYQEILQLLLDEDYGDVTDPTTGRDIKVTVSTPPGKKWAETNIVAKPNKSILSEDPAQVQAWTNAIPDLDTMFTLKSYEELSNIINSWLSDEPAEGADPATPGTSRGGTVQREQPSAPGKVHDDLDSAFAGLMSDD